MLPPPPLVAYLDTLVQRLRELVPLAFREGQVEAIHQARVATRRLTAAVELFAGTLSEKRCATARKTLRRLRRRLGELRDLDVMVAHLRDARRPARRVARATEWLATRLAARRGVLAAGTAADVDTDDLLDRLDHWAGVRDEIARAGEVEHRRLLADSLAAQVADFGGRADAREGDPHELRIAGKQLRYTFEMAREAGLHVPAKVPRAFKAMQDALGLWHDHVVLALRAAGEAAEAQLAVHDAGLFRECLDLAREMTRRAEARLRHFHDLWDATGALLRQAAAALGRDDPPTQAPPEAPADRVGQPPPPATPSDEAPAPAGA